jgi:hypothetical protein
MSNLVKIKIKGDDQDYFIGTGIAATLLSTCLKVPYALNALEEYESDFTAVYKRMVFNSQSEFTLERAKPEDVKGYKCTK